MTDTASSCFELREEDYIDRRSNIETINHLRRIATKMNSAGYLHDCIHIYTTERSSAITASFQQLKLQKLSQHSARTLDWGSLESIIKDWNRSAIVCVKFLFPHERRLCQQIFQGLGNATGDDCFTQLVKEPAKQLFDTAEALRPVHPSSEKLFRILDLYQTLSSLLPLTNDLFSSEPLECIRVKPAQLLPKLAEAIRRIVSDFEKDVLGEQSPILPIPEIHRFPRYVMNYVGKMCDYRQTLMTLIPSKPLTDETGVSTAGFEVLTPLSLHLIWIIMRLLSNLEAKSKLYKGAYLGNFFIMNNVHYIVSKIEGSSQLRDVIGDGYLMKLTLKLRQVKADYLSFTFDNILYCLRAEGLSGSRIFSSKAKKMTNRLKSFNDGFEKAQRDLANVVVPDHQLLVDLRKSIVEKLIPAYSSFLEQLKSVKGSGKHPAEQHIKYSVKDLETAILGLFKGN